MKEKIMNQILKMVGLTGALCFLIEMIGVKFYDPAKFYFGMQYYIMSGAIVVSLFVFLVGLISMFLIEYLIEDDEEENYEE